MTSSDSTTAARDPEADPRPHIMIVDDEDDVRSALRRTLRKEPYRFSFASSGEEALEMIAQDRPDLIVSDHLMPQMTGLELLKRCRMRYPDVGRIVLTGQAELETVVAAINEGEIFRFLRKPWDETELKLTLHMAVQQIQLERENARLLKQVQQQQRYIKTLEEEHPGIGEVRRDGDGAVVITDEELRALG
jgi:DNA-binding NtrC family response regulator